MRVTTKPVACTLTASAFKERAVVIGDLASRSLLSGQRTPLQLHLTYTADAGARVRDVVAKEQACCAFLDFVVHEDDAGVHVTISAPQEARDSADTLFAHFLPGNAQHLVKVENQ